MANGLRLVSNAARTCIADPSTRLVIPSSFVAAQETSQRNTITDLFWLWHAPAMYRRNVAMALSTYVTVKATKELEHQAI
jgi:hypothetical protein